MYINTRLLVKILFTVIININLNLQVKSQDKPNWQTPLKMCWQYKDENIANTGIASDNESIIYIPKINGQILAINGFTGSFKWKTELGGIFLSKLTINKDFLITIIKIIKNEGNQKKKNLSKLLLINKNNGTIIKSIELNNTLEKQILFSESYIFLISLDGQITKFDYGLKSVVDISLNTQITTNTQIRNKQISLGTFDKTLSEISVIDGSIISQIKFKSIINGNFIYNDENLFLGDNIGNVFSIKSFDGKIIWKIKTGGKIINIINLDKQLLVISNDNFVYMILKKNGKKLWKTKLEGRIIGTGLLNNEQAVFLTIGNRTAPILNLVDGKIINKIELDEKNYFITSPLLFNERLILNTQESIVSYSPLCK